MQEPSEIPSDLWSPDRRATAGARQALPAPVARWPAAAALAVAATLLPAPGGGAVHWVGSGPGCTHATIPAALASAASTPEDDTVVLTRTVSYTNVELDLVDWSPGTTGSLTLQGGIDSCGSLTVNGRTALAGTGSAPVVRVRTTGDGASWITLNDLELTGGAGGLQISGGGRAEVVRTWVRGNSDSGVRVTTGGRVQLDLFTIVSDNSAVATGGGIDCRDSFSRVVLEGIVAFNQAVTAGGGIFARDACEVLLADGGYLVDNSAPLGGGIHLRAGATLWGGPVSASGTSDYGVVISGNEASYGGGLFIHGEATTAQLWDARVDDNSAAQAGGGIAVVEQGQAILRRWASETAPAPPCRPDPRRCATLSGNATTVGGSGSAAYVASGGLLHFAQGYIEGNSGPGEAGFLLFAEGTGSRLWVQGTQLWNNRTISIFEADHSATVLAYFVSAARNRFLVGSEPPYFDSFGAGADGGAGVGIGASILADHGAFSTGSGGQVIGACLLVATAAGITTANDVVAGIDPRFRNPATGNLRLRLDSPAIDACDDPGSPFNLPDYDLEERGYDLPFAPNGAGTFDRGADEVVPLFADGFESGDTSAWSP